MKAMTSVLIGLILLLFTTQYGNCFPISGMSDARPTGFYCFVMPDMTWQCKCPEAQKVYVLFRFPQFALVCNGYNQLEFLSRAGSNNGGARPWSPRETYAYQIKHTVDIAHPQGSWRSTSGAEHLPDVRYENSNSASNSNGYDNTDTTSSSTSSSTFPVTTPTTPVSLPEPIASDSVDNYHKSASGSGSYGQYDYSASSVDSDSSVKKESTMWSSSTLLTTTKPKEELPPKPEVKPKPKVTNPPIPNPEPTEEPRSAKTNKPEEDEDKGCTYMGKHMKKGQSFKPPWGCTLYCNGNNSLFRKC